MQASVPPACTRHPLTQQEGARGQGDVIRQQMLQEEGEEVAVEVAVKYLQADRGRAEAAGPGSKGKSRLCPRVPSPGACQNQTPNQIPIAYLILLKGRRNAKFVRGTIKIFFSLIENTRIKQA